MNLETRNGSNMVTPDLVGHSSLAKTVRSLHDTNPTSLEKMVLFYIPGSHDFEPVHVTTLNGLPLRSLIVNNPEFVELWREKEYLHDDVPRRQHVIEQGKIAYADFLIDPTVPMHSKLFVLTPQFRDYIGSLLHYNQPGPCFYRILGELRTGDVGEIAFINKNLPTFTSLDTMNAGFERFRDHSLPLDDYTYVSWAGEKRPRDFPLKL